MPHLVAIPSCLPLCGHLVVQCASWTRRCALGAPPLCSSESTPRPPSTSISTSTSAEAAQREERGRSSASAIVTEARHPPPLPPGPHFSSRTPTLSDRSVPEVRPAHPLARQQLRAAPCRSAPRRAGPLASPLESRLFPGSWMNYWRVVNKCEKKAEAPGSASSLRPGKTRLSQSCGR